MLMLMRSLRLPLLFFFLLALFSIAFIFPKLIHPIQISILFALFSLNRKNSIYEYLRSNKWHIEQRGRAILLLLLEKL